MKAVITGTGFESADFGKIVGEHHLQSALGESSAKVLDIESSADRFFWLRRHGEKGEIAPHRINYRANIHTLAELGVTQIIAVNSVGGISEACKPGVLVFPDQVIDLTWGRETSFFDGDFLPLQHIDFTQPFDGDLSQQLLACAEQLSLSSFSPATYACSQGPRLETAAEIKAMGIQGADVVGMTAMPEAALARELNMAYAAICPVVNMAAGLSEVILNEQEVRKRAKQMASCLIDLILLGLKSLGEGGS